MHSCRVFDDISLPAALHNLHVMTPEQYEFEMMHQKVNILRRSCTNVSYTHSREVRAVYQKTLINVVNNQWNMHMRLSNLAISSFVLMVM